MRAVVILWVIFSILFFGGAALWQNRSEIVSSLIKKQVENKVKEFIPEELNQILDLEKAVIEGGGLKYNPPSLDLFDREDRFFYKMISIAGIVVSTLIFCIGA